MKDIGAVVEFRLSDFFVYGICCEVDVVLGDSLAMLSKRFDNPIRSVEEIFSHSVKYKQRYFVRHAKSKRNADFLRVAGKVGSDHVPKVDPRYRINLSGISARKCWQIVEQGKQRRVLDFLTKDTAMLSDDGVRGLELIRAIYEKNLYPWSAELTGRGPTDFDPVDFEKEMRQLLPGVE